MNSHVDVPSVLLIRPQTPATSHSGIVSLQYPINIGYLVAFLRSKGVACRVKDFEVEPYSEEEFLKSLDESKPSIVGFSCMTPHVPDASRIAAAVKAAHPHITTVIGGVHATAIPEQTLNEFPQFDVIVRGEGEETLFELTQWLAGHKELADVDGIAYRDEGAVKITGTRKLIEDLDGLAFPERDLISEESYRKSHVSRGFSRRTMKIAEITTSRGCPFDCIFCASKVAHTRKVRFRSADNIIAEMETLIAKGVQHFSFLDDTFTLRDDVLLPICDFMRRKRVTFDCCTRVNSVDRQRLELMKASGCRKISFGVESGSPRVLKLLKKQITAEEAVAAFDLCRKVGMRMTEATFMIGTHPSETLEDIEMTRKLIDRLRPDLLACAVTIPYPGTEINRLLKEEGMLKEESWEYFSVFFSDPPWEVCQVPMDRLKELLKEITSQYYFSPRYILSSLSKIRSLGELKYWMGVALSFVKVIKEKKGLEA